MSHSALRPVISVIVIILSFLIYSTNEYAQRFSEISLSNGEHIKIEKPQGGFYSVLTTNGKVQSEYKENPDEVVRLIVMFKDQPLAAFHFKKSPMPKISVESAFASLQAGHASFRTALNSVSRQLSAQLKTDYSYKITRDYYMAINGVALQCKRGIISRLRALSMVEYISWDREVKASLNQSVHQIRADIVHDSLGITGKGVLVGDIDTGIDYKNPALGGGFGPGFRVIGGYDFVDNDNDPMDDHGHGTHVAGIIGANGDTLRGVAPDVKFLAVKVLGADGSGFFSDVIAGIEYCLDPDGNPGTDDAADLINMSLGGEPSEDDPVDSAVANATKAGVLCIVSAGNEGNLGYGTIGSPGTSPSALTVGACDSAYNIAYFSSIGPDPIYSFIKPEVVAPGVNILSTILNDQTATWSGTSMAAPHVTGTAALLKQEHPSWTPDEIKAAIINSAHSAGDNVSIFAQGKGCIDALDAAETRMVVAPGVMSFGYDDLSKDVWIDTVKLTIGNFHSTAQNTLISIVDGPPNGATLTFDKTSFSLAPGEETTIKAILSVPSSVPVLSTEPFAYFGKIKVSSDSDNVVVPFCFIKSTTLVVNFDLPPVFLDLIDRKNGIINYIENSGLKYTIHVSEGNSLDLLAVMLKDTLGVWNSYLVHHIINNPTGLTYVFVSHDEAKINMAGDTLYDIHNNRVAYDSTIYAKISFQLVVNNESYTFRSELETDWIFPPYQVRLFFPPLDSAFLIKKIISLSRDSNNYIFSRSIFGLQQQQDVCIASGVNNLVGYHVTASYDDPYLSIPSHWRKSIPVDLNTMRVHPGLVGYRFESTRLNFPSQNLDQKARPIINFYFNKPGINDAKNDKYFYSSMDIGASYFHQGLDSDGLINPSTLRTPDFTINGNGEAIFEQMHVTPLSDKWPMIAKLSSAYVYETVKPGGTIKIEQNAHLNFPDYMTYLINGSLFMGCNNDWLKWEQVDYYIDTHGGIKQLNGVNECRDNFNLYWGIPLFTPQVFTQNRIQINMQQFTPLISPVWLHTDAPAYDKFNNINNDVHVLHIISDAYPYKILGQAGQSTAGFEYRIPTNPGDTTLFPSFNLLQVSVDGKGVDNVQSDQNGIIRLIPFNPDSSITSVKISLLLASGDEINLPAIYVGGNEYDASIPSYIPAGFIDVIAKLEDSKGNICELTASPGFYFGSTSNNIKVDARLRMTSYKLNNVDSINLNTGDTLNYTIAFANYGSDIARDVEVKFPSTQYLKLLGIQSWTIDSLVMNDTVHIPVSLVFLGKQQLNDEYTDYSPSITWTSGNTKYTRKYNVFVDFNTITDIAQINNIIPNRFELYQNYPNPFNPSTTIKYDLPKQSRVNLVVYDVLGREMATLVDKTEKAGSYHVIWNASRHASGVYFYRLEAGGYSAVKKFLLVK